jgi:tripartite-type tricarboxylate transporter receptor subunit TctC
MAFARRDFLHLAAGAFALPALGRVALAQVYPSRPARFVVGFPAGGAQDLPARIIAQWLTEQLGQPFTIENIPGSGTNVATETVVHAPPDGYTLLLVVTANTVNGTLYPKLNFDFGRDIAPVASISRVPLVMVVHPSVPARTVPEFITYAKANPGKLKIGSTGPGGTPHLAGELFKMLTGLDMTSTPFRGVEGAQNGVVEGQAQVMFTILPEGIENIKAGKLRALGVSTTGRIAALPDLPPVADFVPGYEASTWNGVGVPRNTPPDIVERLSQTISAGLADPKIKARIAELGSIPLPASPTEFARFLAGESEKWGKVVKFAGLKVE